MKTALGWHWPDNEQHLLDWLVNPKGATTINGRAAYQGKKQLAALELCPPDRRRTAIDIGAHIGLWSFNLTHWFGLVEAFEPVAAHRECFVENVKHPNVALRPVALGDREGRVAIYTGPTSTGDSWVSGEGQIPMHTLDSYEFQAVDFIKIDTEGFEEKVLRGAVETIRHWQPVVIVEQKRRMATERFGLEPLGAVKFLVGMGYKTACEMGGDYIMIPG